ncbi:MAG: hypothetical protein P8I94_09945, partial [Emcibacteraceae bacterium]|nr:hypothetical protein [Emcibacteraceae bacterium]
LINQLEQLFKLHNSTQPNINKSIFRKSNSDKTTAFKSELGTLLRGTLKSGLNIFSAKHFLLSKLITLFMNHVDESKDSIGDQIEGVLNHGFKKAENLMTQDKKVASASDESGHAVDQMQIILNSDDDTKIKNAIPASLQITYCSGDDVATCQVEQEKYKQPNVHQI